MRRSLIKQPPLSWVYVATILILVLVLDLAPYLEELVRGVRARRAAQSSG